MPLGTTNFEVEFPLCFIAVLESGCTQVQSWLAPSSPALAKRIVVPGGPGQYCAVQQYSVVRRIWGAGGVAGFLIFAPPTPPQNLIAEILSTPVRCTDVLSTIAQLKWAIPLVLNEIDCLSAQINVFFGLL